MVRLKIMRLEVKGVNFDIFGSFFYFIILIFFKKGQFWQFWHKELQGLKCFNAGGATLVSHKCNEVHNSVDLLLTCKLL